MSGKMSEKDIAERDFLIEIIDSIKIKLLERGIQASKFIPDQQVLSLLNDPQFLSQPENLKIVDNRLRKLAKFLNDAYYKGESLVSDELFDALIEAAKQLGFNLLSRTTGSKNAIWDIISHKIPMQSLQKALTLEDMAEFYKRITSANPLNKSFFGEPKIDGNSFSAYYRNGELQYVATRGDGKQGTDITHNLDYMEDLPRKIDISIEEIEVRGEIYMPLKNFNLLKNEKILLNEDIPSNPRNTVSGILRRLPEFRDKNRTLLKYFAYSIGVASNLTIKTQEYLIELLANLGFTINRESKLLENLNDIISYHSYLKDKRTNLDYEIDGVVIKVNDIELQKSLGGTIKSPRWAIAYKFEPAFAVTKLLGISVQVGRSGVLTPIALLEPTEIMDVIVKKCTLHNKDEIIRLGLNIGDTVKIKRSGDVIPKIVEVIEHSSPNHWSFPLECPACGTDVVTDGPFVYCPNQTACPEQAIETIAHFVSKKALDIEGLGYQTVRTLYNNHSIQTIADIFSLTHESFKEKTNNNQNQLPLSSSYLEGFAKKSIDNLLENIEKSQHTSIAKFIYALGIKNIGEGSAELIARTLETKEEFVSILENIAYQYEDYYNKILNIKGVGEISAKNFVSFLKYNSAILLKILQFINLEATAKLLEPIEENFFTGKIVVFTGNMKISRDIAKSLIKQAGGTVSESVSKNTSLLIVGENPGSKYEKAKKLGVDIFSEEDFLAKTPQQLKETL